MSETPPPEDKPKIPYLNIKEPEVPSKAAASIIEALVPQKEVEKQSKTAKLILEQKDEVAGAEDDEIFFGALFNLEHSPAFKFLEQKRVRKELPEKRWV